MVIMGLKKGKNIVKTIVVDLENNMEVEADMDMEEHLQDLS